MLESKCDKALMACWLEQGTLNRSSLVARSWFSSAENAFDDLSYQQLDALIEQGELLKHDVTTSVVRIGIAGRNVIVKRFNARSQWHRLNRAIRQSRASRCWQMSYSFQQAGLSVARPLLMFERRFGPLRRTAYFVSEALDGVELLSNLASFPESEKKLLVKAINDAFLCMKKNRLSHGDLKASNLIWQDGRLYFIDLDAARHHTSEQSWLSAHKKDCDRFLKNWRDDEGLVSLFESLSQ